MDTRLQEREKQFYCENDLKMLEHFTLKKSPISSFLLKTYRASIQHIINTKHVINSATWKSGLNFQFS